jgi:hypothetical protein
MPLNAACQWSCVLRCKPGMRSCLPLSIPALTVLVLSCVAAHNRAAPASREITMRTAAEAHRQGRVQDAGTRYV